MRRNITGTVLKAETPNAQMTDSSLLTHFYSLISAYARHLPTLPTSTLPTLDVENYSACLRDMTLDPKLIICSAR